MAFYLPTMIELRETNQRHYWRIDGDVLSARCASSGDSRKKQNLAFHIENYHGDAGELFLRQPHRTMAQNLYDSWIAQSAIRTSEGRSAKAMPFALTKNNSISDAAGNGAPWKHNDVSRIYRKVLCADGVYFVLTSPASTISLRRDGGEIYTRKFAIAMFRDPHTPPGHVCPKIATSLGTKRRTTNEEK